MTGWTRRRRASSCASSPPAPTFQSLKTFAKNFSFRQSLRLVGTTTTKALKPAVTAAMTPGTTSLATVIPRMSCYIKFTFFCVVLLHVHVCVLQLHSSFCMLSSMHRLKERKHLFLFGFDLWYKTCLTIYIKYFSATIQTESNSIFPMGSTMIFPMPRKFSLQRWSTWESRYSINIYLSKQFLFFCVFVPSH